jgi:hypothetical protein
VTLIESRETPFAYAPTPTISRSPTVVRKDSRTRIAELLADDLGTRVEYVWWAQRRGFLRNTLNAGTCDVVMGLPTSVEMALTTDPYYRSTYVFVSRRDRHLRIRSLTMPG